jgi:hypothetical protein
MSSIIVDFNGTGIWSKEEILRRYKEYCLQFNTPMLDLMPMIHENGDKQWIYPVMEKVIEGIKGGDAACRVIGIEFIEEDKQFPFGKILKANTAVALRQNHLQLSENERERIRIRVVSLLTRNLVPHEFREYAKLMKKIGIGNYKETLASINTEDPYVLKFSGYLLET